MTEVLTEITLPYNSPRRPRTRGFGPLGMLGTAVVGCGLIFGIIVATFMDRVAGIFVFALTGAFFILAAWKDNSRQGPLEKGVDALGWLRQRNSGHHKYLPGPLTVIGDYLVPGTGAKSVLTQGVDMFGHSYGLLSYPQTGHHVLNIQASPDGAALADAITIQQRDTRYGEWLAGLGSEPGLEQLAISVEIAPDAQPALFREIEENLRPDSPPLAQQMLRECLTLHPSQGGASSRAFITMTFRTPAGTERSEIKRDGGVAAMREHLSTRIPDILAPLPATGAGPVSLMTADDVIRVVRCAYNPGDRANYEELAARGEPIPVQEWHSAGPSGAEESKGSYAASDGVSITWGTTGFTGTQVAARAMKPLAKDPPAAVHTLRITWLFKPIGPGRAGFIAEADHAAAKQRKLSSGKDPSARAVEDAAAANRTRLAEASGAGLANFACLVTATVLERDDDSTAKLVKRAKSGVEHMGPAARLNLRVLRGSQAPAFAQGLGVLGLVTSSHLLIPTSIRKAG